MPQAVLVLGGTGRIGSRVVQLLLDRGLAVKAIVRSAEKLKSSTRNDLLQVIQGSILDLSAAELAGHIQGCCAVVMALGHNLNFMDLFVRNHTMVTKATRLVCAAAAMVRLDSGRPLRFVKLSTGGARNPDGSDNVSRGLAERVFIACMSSLLPPWSDSIKALQHLGSVGNQHPYLEWCAVRPEWFRDGPAAELVVSPTVRSLFAETGTRMDSIAAFMTDLVTKDDVWTAWKFKMPHIRDADSVVGLDKAKKL